MQRFDQDSAFQYGRSQGHAAAHHQRPRQFQHQYRKARLIQAIDNACAQVAAAAYDDQISGKWSQPLAAYPMGAQGGDDAVRRQRNLVEPNAGGVVQGGRLPGPAG